MSIHRSIILSIDNYIFYLYSKVYLTHIDFLIKMTGFDFNFFEFLFILILLPALQFYFLFDFSIHI